MQHVRDHVVFPETPKRDHVILYDVVLSEARVVLALPILPGRTRGVREILCSVRWPARLRCLLSKANVSTQCFYLNLARIFCTSLTRTAIKATHLPRNRATTHEDEAKGAPPGVFLCHRPRRPRGP